MTGWGRFRVALPVWSLTDNTDSMSGQRRRRTSSPPRGSDAPSSTAGDDYVEVAARLQIKRGTAWPIFARYQRTGEVVRRPRGGAQHHWLDDKSKDLLVMCLDDNLQLTLKHLALILQQSLPAARAAECRRSAGGAGGDVATLGGWRRRILLDGISIAMQSVTGDQVDAQYRHSNTFLPECATKSDI